MTESAALTPSAVSVQTMPIVAVHIVTWNSARDIRNCLESVKEQVGFALGQNLFIRITDNNSTDATVTECEQVVADGIELFVLPENTGFCRAHNEGISALLKRGAEFVFVLNPDVRLEKDALLVLVQALLCDSLAGTATPKLLRADENLRPTSPPRLDAAGMYITPAMRHFDRGSEELDERQFDSPEYVFGGSGAALAFRRACLIDIAHGVLGGPTSERYEIFDEMFFAYREDADLAWRLQRAGWKCRYEPESVAYHRRVVLPERRKQLSAEINAYGVRNRFLLQLKNWSVFANFRHLPETLFRNAVVIAGVLFAERSSIPALLELRGLFRQTLGKRRQIFSKQRVSACAIREWFSRTPVAQQSLSRKPRAHRVNSVLLIVVNYNSGTHLSRCLESIKDTVAQLRDLSLSVVIMDNASGDSSFSDAQKAYGSEPAFHFVPCSNNLGFAGAINLAASEYGAVTTADAFLVLNPDILVDATVLRQLAGALESYDALGAVAPVLQSPDLVPQLGFVARRFPCPASAIAELFLLHRLWPNNPWTRRALMTDEPLFLQALRQEKIDSRLPHYSSSLPILVDQPAGACLMVHREAFEAVGGFDQSFWPAWFEDVDLCKRLSASKWASAIVPNCSAIHSGGHSLQYLGSRRFAICWYPNVIRYWNKHGGAFWGVVIRACLCIGLLARSLFTYIWAGAVRLLPSGIWKRSPSVVDLTDLARTYFELAIGVGSYDKARIKQELEKSSEPVAS